MNWEEILRRADMEPTQRKKPAHLEDKLQIQCVRWFTYQYPRLASLLHHSPNGGARSKTEGAIFKQMGVRAGFPDLFLYHPNGQAHGLAIEMKTTDRGSHQSESQKQWQALLTAEGYEYHVCRTFEDFQNIINKYINSHD